MSRNLELAPWAPPGTLLPGSTCSTSQLLATMNLSCTREETVFPSGCPLRKPLAPWDHFHRNETKFNQIHGQCFSGPESDPGPFRVLRSHLWPRLPCRTAEKQTRSVTAEARALSALPAL